jgi:hypothetical protein
MLASATLGWVLPASANTGGSASASLTDIRTGLVDLALSDGAAPSLLLDPSLAFTELAVKNRWWTDDSTVRLDREGWQQQGNLAWGDRQVTVGPDFLSASVTSHAINENRNAYVFTRGQAPGAPGFVLSPHTRLTFDGVMNLEVVPADMPCVALDDQGHHLCQQARASLGVNIGFPNEVISQGREIWPDIWHGADPVRISSPISFSIDNDSDLARPIWMGMALNVSVWSFDNLGEPLPVPEPGTALLATVGLALLLGLRRPRGPVLVCTPPDRDAAAPASIGIQSAAGESSAMKRALSIGVFAALLACASLCRAAPTTYVYTILGLSSQFLGIPAVPLEGTFTGEDLNHDGEISLPELSNFNLGDAAHPWLDGSVRQLLPAQETPVEDLSCVPEPDPEVCRLWSVLQQFTYDQHSGAFTAVGSYPIDYHASTYIATGSRIGIRGPGGSGWWYDWTPNTYVVVRPIPEPGTLALFAMGLLGISVRFGRLVRIRHCAHAQAAA